MRIFLLILIALAPTLSWGQGFNWGRLGGGLNGETRVFYYDSLNKKLYIGGQFNKAENKTAYGVAVWDGTKWDSLETGLDNQPAAITGFNNKIYFGGNFSHTFPNNKSYYFIASWNGMSWDSMPQKPNGNISDLIVYNGQLYACGAFNKFGDTVCNYVARFDGTNWHPVGDLKKYFKNCPPAQINCITFYKNELYLGGSFPDSNCYNPTHIVKYDGVKWTTVGQGIKQTFAWVDCMKEYKGELYLGGYFEKTAQTVSQHLMKWNGSTFLPVGNFGLDGQVFDFAIVKKKLFISGSFQHLDSTKAGNILFTDSAKYCSPAAYSGMSAPYCAGFWPLAAMNDSLVIGGYYDYVDTMKTNNIAVLYGNFDSFPNCQFQGIKEYSNDFSAEVFPNPFQSTLQIKLPQLTNTESISIVNSLGQSVFETRLNSQVSEINLSSLPPGIYYLNIQSNGKYAVKKIVKQ